MDFHVDDDGFVRAPRGLVYRRLTDLRRWPEFWPGSEVLGEHDDGAGFDVQLRSRVSRLSAFDGRGPRLSLALRPSAWRHDEGFRIELRGDVRGDAEFWLEEGWGGTVVHHLAQLQTDRIQTGRAYRAALRLGLGGLKDDLQSDVRTKLGLVA